MFRSWFHSPVFAWAGDRPNESERDWFLFQHGEHRGRHRDQGRGRHHGRGRQDEWGDEFRTRRGDVKFLLLELLSDSPNHGYNLIKEMESRYGEFRRLSPGSVYPTLQMLEEGGHLTSEQVSGKRVYSITDAGRELLAERPQSGASNSAQASRNASPELGELRNALTDLSAAVIQVARSGDTARISQVRERLEQVKREIYGMLAEQ